MSRSRKSHPDPPWKKDERKIARDFHLERNPLSGNRTAMPGNDSRKLRPEECEALGIKESPPIQIEVKRREGKKRFYCSGILDEARNIAKKHGDIGIVALKEKGRHGYVVCVHSKDLKRFAEEVTKHYAPDSSA